MNENLFEYTVDDLDNIYVTASDKTGNMAKVPLKQLSNDQFEIWAKHRFQQFIPDDITEHFGQVWNYHDRVNLLNRMTEVLGRPCVVMQE
jgi:hypothetical protein